MGASSVGLVRSNILSVWSSVQANIRKISSISVIRPSSCDEIFRATSGNSGGEIKVVVTPVVFLVPERALHHTANLYVVVSGWIDFDTDLAEDRRLAIRSFGTKVAYVRSKVDSCEHIFGAHYDVERSDFGHPVFHAQVRPQMDLCSHVGDVFRSGSKVDNHIDKVIRSVRIPTAEMDVFSVFVQICSDHLIHGGLSDVQRKAFVRLCKSCSMFSGCSVGVRNFRSVSGLSGYRGSQWYVDAVP